MEYYLAVKKNEVMSFAATWVDLEMVLLSGISQVEREKYPYDSTYMWNRKKKKKNTNELIYKTEIESQILKRNLWLPRRKRGYQGGEVRSLALTCTHNST